MRRRQRVGLVAAAGVLTVAAEVAVLTVVAGWIGPWPAVLALLAVSMIGAGLLRRESILAWRRLRAALHSGQPPGDQALHTVVGLLAALALLVPGFVTGAVGALALVPPVRAALRRWLAGPIGRWLGPAGASGLFGPTRVRVRQGAGWSGPPPADRPEPGAPTIDGEIIDP